MLPAIVCLSILGEILCLVPWMFEFQVSWAETNNSLQSAFMDFGFKATLVCCITLALPLFLEIFRDCLLAKSNRVSLSAFFCNLILAFSILVPDLILYVYIVPRNDVLLFICINQARGIAVTSSIFIYLVHFGGKHFKRWAVLLCHTSACLSFLMFLWGALKKSHTLVYHWSAASLLFLSTGYFTYAAVAWCRTQYNIIRVGSRALTTSEHSCNVVLIASGICYSGLLCSWIAFGTPEIENFCSEYLIITNMFYALFYVIISVFQGSVLTRDILIEVR